MDMLSYSKEREPAIEETDLNQLVRDVLELTAGRAKDVAAKVDTRLDEALPRVQADPDGVHRALLNIIGNAMDAIEDVKKPQLGIATMLDPREDGWVGVLVIDNGPGILPEKLEEIFRPFVSSKGSKGTGLGLAVSRKILREHGGDIEVESQPGRTKFYLRLPVKSPLLHENTFGSGEHKFPPPEAG